MKIDTLRECPNIILTDTLWHLSESNFISFPRSTVNFNINKFILPWQTFLVVLLIIPKY